MLSGPNPHMTLRIEKPSGLCGCAKMHLTVQVVSSTPVVVYQEWSLVHVDVQLYILSAGEWFCLDLRDFHGYLTTSGTSGAQCDRG